MQCNRIELLFVSNQHNPDRIANASSPQGTKNLLAYRSDDSVTDGVEFWVPIPIFTKELVDGADKAALIGDRKSTRLNSSHRNTSRMPSSA